MYSTGYSLKKHTDTRKMKNLRRLKIHRKHQARAYRKTITIPQIILEGKWLDRLGIMAGLMVNVEQRKNKLIITVHKE